MFQDRSLLCNFKHITFPPIFYHHSGGTLRYLITEGNTGGTFEVQPEDGEIRLGSPLDFEKQTEYILKYSANDGLFVADTEIRIHVQNVNDERPQFENNLYTVVVAEEDDNYPRSILTVR